MNPLKFINAQTATSQLEREGRKPLHSIKLVETIADWRMRIRLWNLLHQRYLFALRENDSQTARLLFGVLKETRMVVNK